MRIADIPASTPAGLVRHAGPNGVRLSLWSSGRVLSLDAWTLDGLLRLKASEVRKLLDAATVPLEADADVVLAPVEHQEVWAAGVTYRRSRDARIEEAVTGDPYERVYTAERPEVFFKSNGWRVVGPDGLVGIRSDSTWDVPEPELAVLTNAHGEPIAYACGNDMSSRSIEGANALYLPQAKVYDGSCAIGPVAVLAWGVDVRNAPISVRVVRAGVSVFSGTASVADMVRNHDELARVVHAAYTLPVGAWVLTGTGVVPPIDWTLAVDDQITVEIGGVGILSNRVQVIAHSGATALPNAVNQ